MMLYQLVYANLFVDIVDIRKTITRLLITNSYIILHVNMVKQIKHNSEHLPTCTRGLISDEVHGLAAALAQPLGGEASHQVPGAILVA